MKKFFVAAACALMLALSACAPDYDAINAHIDNHEELSQKDYAGMIQYLEDINKEYPGTPSMSQVKEISEKYPYFAKFGITVTMADAMGKLDEKNAKRFDDLSL